MTASEDSRRRVDPVEEASRDSFPASDPPGWIAARPGRPLEAPAPRTDEKSGDRRGKVRAPRHRGKAGGVAQPGAESGKRLKNGNAV